MKRRKSAKPIFILRNSGIGEADLRINANYFLNDEFMRINTNYF